MDEERLFLMSDRLYVECLNSVLPYIDSETETQIRLLLYLPGYIDNHGKKTGILPHKDLTKVRKAISEEIVRNYESFAVSRGEEFIPKDSESIPEKSTCFANSLDVALHSLRLMETENSHFQEQLLTLSQNLCKSVERSSRTFRSDSEFSPENLSVLRNLVTNEINIIESKISEKIKVLEKYNNDAMKDLMKKYKKLTKEIGIKKTMFNCLNLNK